MAKPTERGSRTVLAAFSSMVLLRCTVGESFTNG